MKAILETLRRPGNEDKPAGRALIYVWALEQRDSRRGWDEGGEQDVMVPWVMKTGTQEKSKGKKERGKGKKGGKKVRDGEAVESQKDEVKEVEAQEQETERQAQDKTFLRYYHLYRKGELEHDIEEAGGTVVEAGYEKDNWWAVAIPKGQTFDMY